MDVRLRNREGGDEGTLTLRHRVRVRTILHQGQYWELVAETPQGQRIYRASEAIPPPLTRRVDVVDSGGNVRARAAVAPNTIPESVIVNGLVCLLWTARDQTGQPVYLMPDPEPEAA